MVEISDSKEVLNAWVEKNLTPKIPGAAKRAAFTVIVRRLINNAEQAASVFAGTAAGLALAGSGIVQGTKIDESVLPEFRKELGAGKIEIDVPVIGRFELDGDAVDSLYAALSARAEGGKNEGRREGL